MGPREQMTCVAAAMLSWAGCSLPTGAIAPQADTGTVPGIDSGAIDVGPRIDAWSDIDTGPRPDLGVADDAYVSPGHDAYVQPGHDAYVPPGHDAWVAPNDAWVAPNDAWVAPNDAYRAPDAWRSCDQIYSTVVSGYSACADNANTCVFVAFLDNGDSCNTMCNLGTGGCMSEFHNGGSMTSCTTMGTDEGCGTGHHGYYRICTCNH